MLILAIDSASSGCNACVWRDELILALRQESMDRGQDARLLPVIIEAMAAAKISYDALDLIAVLRGPGSFTGLRIGLAAARGLGLAANKPVLGIDRFSIFKKQINQPDHDLLVVINAKRAEMYCRFYPRAGGQSKTMMLTSEEITEFLSLHPHTIITGDIIPGEFASRSFTNFREANEAEVKTLAVLANAADRNDPEILPRPLYVRPPDVTLKKKKLHLRQLNEDDAAHLSRIHGEAFPTTGWNLQQMYGSLALNTTEGWAVHKGDQISGFLVAQILLEEAEILTICTIPSMQKQGIGEYLVQHFLMVLSERGIKSAFLEVASDNIAARKLYEKCGFTISGKRPGYYMRPVKSMDAIMYRWTNEGRPQG